MSDSASPRSKIPASILVFAFSFSAIGVFAYRQDYVTAGSILIVTLAGLAGYRMGLARMIGWLGGLTLAVVLAPTVGAMIEPHVAELLGLTGLYSRFTAVGAAGFAILTVVALSARIIGWLLFRDRPLLSACNQWLGFVGGSIQGAVLVVLLIGGVLVVEPMARERLDAAIPYQSDALARATSKQVVRIAEQTHASAIGPWIVRNNPFERVPALRRMLNTARVASNPDQFANWQEEAGNSAWQESPTIQDAIDRLHADPEIREIVASGQRIDQTTVLSLLDNPTIVDLASQPGLVKELWTLMDQVE